MAPGGSMNNVGGAYSFGAGRRAKANYDGCFVWGDSTNADVGATVKNQFIVRATGGVLFYTKGDLSTGVRLAKGGTSWIGFSTSDKSLKRDIQTVDVREVLFKLSQIPISRWSYTSEDPRIQHMGAMSQDFYAAFGLGEDDKHIYTVDADGVALAAIQGLYDLVREKEARIAEQERRIDELEERLKSLEMAVTQ